jgi:subtilase family serine protease
VRVLASVVVSVLLLSSVVFTAAATVTWASSAPTAAPVPYTGYRFLNQAPQDMPVLVSLAVPLRNTGLLDSLAKQVSDPSSPEFRHFLTEQQIANEFLPIAAFNSLLQYVKGSGLDVLTTGLDSVIVAEGTAAQVQNAFGASVDVYTNGTSSYYITSGPATFQGAYLYASNATFIYSLPADVASASSPSGVTFTEGGMSAQDLQAVYNATTLYSSGFNGSGQTIGILDFYGSPTITSDLHSFDQIFGLPDITPTITPIGPYAPNLGVSVGWSTEISLDVETSHAMAPGAAVQLYVANGAYTLADALAVIVGDDTVTTLSQSFGTPEWYFSMSYYFGGPAFVALEALIPDQYYALGSLEGITFLASTGDGGGSGFSSGPEGTPEYPATSPFVTAVGGTQTYISATQGGGSTFTQTAWSNIGFVPNSVNNGGGGGGVSILEPMPWYQQSQQVPALFPNGRLNPDLSLQAGLDPGTYIVDSGSVTAEGGTSESVQLLSGLLTLVAQSAGGPLGLINPFLYSIGDNSSTYASAFTPITTGYIVPWTSSYGYNLATGWGAPNIGALASLYDSYSSQPSLYILVAALDPSSGQQLGEVTPGQNMTVVAEIGEGLFNVVSGSFTASLVTLAGTSLVTPLSFNTTSGVWEGTMTEGNQSGFAYISVAGSSKGLSGTGITTIFAGYLASFIDPFPNEPWSTLVTLEVDVVSTDLLGNSAPTQPIQMEVNPYSITTNRYTTASTVTLQGNSTTGVNTGFLSGTYPYGPLALVLQGSSYAYLPMVNGIYLQSSYIYTQVAAEPGSVAPGQSIFIQANPEAPMNLASLPSYETGLTLGDDVAVGSNVTATLLNPSGVAVATASLDLQACNEALRICNSGATNINGYLTVPANALPGLYTIILEASYDSVTVEQAVGEPQPLLGTFYSQVLVSGGAITPAISFSSSTLYEGQTVQVIANIAYANGTEVEYGEYTALVYPQELQSSFTEIMHSEYANFELTPLQYSPQLNRWVGDLTLPSPYDAASLNGVNDNSFYYAGPYEAYITGLSFDGTPTTSQLSAQQSFFVDPYVYTANQNLSSVQQTFGLALSNTMDNSSVQLSGDVFLDNNTVKGGSVTISSSSIVGTLVAVNTDLTLVGVYGGNIVAENSVITLVQSDISSLSLASSQVSLNSSTVKQLSPALPSIQVQSPASGQNYEGTLGISVTVGGQQLSSVSFYLDGSLLNSFSSGSSSPYAYQLNTTSIPDGEHTLKVVAEQADGMSATAYAYFSTDNHLAAANSTIASLNQQLGTANSNIGSLNQQLGTANSNIGSLNKQLSTANSNATDLSYELYGVAALAVISLLIAIMALSRKEKAPVATTQQQSTPGQGDGLAGTAGPQNETKS